MKILITRASPANSARTCERDSRPNVILIKRLSLAFFVRLARTWRGEGEESGREGAKLQPPPPSSAALYPTWWNFIHQVYTKSSLRVSTFLLAILFHFYRPSPLSLSLSLSRRYICFQPVHETTVCLRNKRPSLEEDNGRRPRLEKRSG